MVHILKLQNWFYYVHFKISWYFPGSPEVETLPFSVGGTRSIPSQGTKIPHALWPKKQNRKQKHYCNKLKTFKMAHIKKIFGKFFYYTFFNGYFFITGCEWTFPTSSFSHIIFIWKKHSPSVPRVLNSLIRTNNLYCVCQ